MSLKIDLSGIIDAGKCSKLVVNAFRDVKICNSICATLRLSDDTSCGQVPFSIQL